MLMSIERPVVQEKRLENAYIPQHTAELLPGPWLVLAPHPDDETFGMGGAIALALRQGISVDIIILTDGALGGIDCGDLVVTRERETRAAVAALGNALVVFWRYPDRGLEPTSALVTQLADYIQAGHFAAVFFPSVLEPHPDHRAAAVLAWEALRRLNFPARPISFDISVQGPVNRLWDITPVIGLKIAAMRCHYSQEAERPYLRRILALNRSRTWSLPAKVKYAESFYEWLPRDIALGDQVMAMAAHWAEGVTFPEPTPVDRLDQPPSPAILGQATKPCVLIVLATHIVGGAEMQTLQLMTGLHGSFNLVLLSHRALMPWFAHLDIQRCEFEEYGLDNPFDYSRSNMLRYARAIAEAARDTSAGVIYAVMHNASVFLSLARWRFARTLRGRICIGSLHGSLIGYFQQRGYVPSVVEKLMLRLALYSLHRIITPSQGVANELIKHFNARPERVRAIYNGLDPDSIRYRAAMPLPLEKTQPWIMTSCRLTEQKDFKTLLQAFAEVTLQPLPRLMILGEGPLHHSIIQWAETLGVSDRVEMVGFQDNPFNWMHHADVFVLSSFYEGFGCVLLEAMILGIPVIASDCPWGPAEILQQGQYGMLFPTGDYQALAQALTQLLTDTTERERLAAAARLRADDFSWTAMVDAYTEVFTTAVAECERLAPSRQRNP